MIDLTIQTAPAYLASLDFSLAGLRVTALGGGVSNQVILCEWPRNRLVLKQSLGRLRVDEEWLADRSRIEREWAALEVAHRLMPAYSVPRVQWTDRGNCLYAMLAAPSGAQSWKEVLLGKRKTIPGIGKRVAAMLGQWIGRSWKDDALMRQFGDKTAFDQLRLDPYYRFTASRHPHLKEWFAALVEGALQSNLAMVHGDWSPKNILVNPSDPPADRLVWAIDFEVVHFGDPAFDVAFLLNHLLLKWIHQGARATSILNEAAEFWQELSRHVPEHRTELEASTTLHLPALMLARVDGKSPAEYLRPAEREFVRARSLEWIGERPRGIDEVLTIAAKWRIN